MCAELECNSFCPHQHGNRIPDLPVLRHTRAEESVRIRERLKPRCFSHGQRAILLGQEGGQEPPGFTYFMRSRFCFDSFAAK